MQERKHFARRRLVAREIYDPPDVTIPRVASGFTDLAAEHAGSVEAHEPAIAANED